MSENLVKSQVSRHSLRRTCNEWRTSSDLANANREIADLRKLLADAQKELDGVGEQLDCALGHLRECSNYIATGYQTAAYMGVAVSIPHCLIAATEFLAGQDVAQEQVGRDG